MLLYELLQFLDPVLLLFSENRVRQGGRGGADGVSFSVSNVNSAFVQKAYQDAFKTIFFLAQVTLQLRYPLYIPGINPQILYARISTATFQSKMQTH